MAPTGLACSQHWIPAYAGMTLYRKIEAAMLIWIPAYAGMAQMGGYLRLDSRLSGNDGLYLLGDGLFAYRPLYSRVFSVLQLQGNSCQLERK